MRKLFFVFLILVASGYIYAPYRTTSRYVAAVKARDPKILNELTDYPSVLQSVKDGTREIVTDFFARQIPANVPAHVRQGELKKRIDWWETGLAANYDPAKTEANLAAQESDRLDAYEYTAKGWRSPVTFVAVDSNNGRDIWELGRSGWKRVRDESPKEVHKAKFDRLIARLREMKR